MLVSACFFVASTYVYRFAGLPPPRRYVTLIIAALMTVLISGMLLIGREWIVAIATGLLIFAITIIISGLNWNLQKTERAQLAEYLTRDPEEFERMRHHWLFSRFIRRIL